MYKPHGWYAIAMVRCVHPLALTRFTPSVTGAAEREGAMLIAGSYLRNADLRKGLNAWAGAMLEWQKRMRVTAIVKKPL